MSSTDTGVPAVPVLTIKQLQQALDQCATADRAELIRGLRQLRERTAKKQPISYWYRCLSGWLVQYKLQTLPVDNDEWGAVQQAEVRQYQFMLQEFRVSLFTQQLKTAQPVSQKRLDAQWQEVVNAFS